MLVFFMIICVGKEKHFETTETHQRNLLLLQFTQTETDTLYYEIFVSDLNKYFPLNITKTS